MHAQILKNPLHACLFPYGRFAIEDRFLQVTDLHFASQGHAGCVPRRMLQRKAHAHLRSDSYKALARSRVVQARVRQAVRHALEALPQQHTLSWYELHRCR